MAVAAVSLGTGKPWQCRSQARTVALAPWFKSNLNVFKSQTKTNFSLLKVYQEKNTELAAKWGKKGVGKAEMGVDSLNQKNTVPHLSSMILLFLFPAEDCGLMVMLEK